jgi:hypothetical protein
MSHQDPMLTDPRRRPVRLGNHVQRQEDRQHLGVDLVALAGALGDHSQLLGMRQHQPVGQALDQQEEPFVGGGRLDDDLKSPQLLEKGPNGRRLVATEPGPFHHFRAAGN